MLDNVSEQIRECLEAAENCARKAAGLPDSSPFKQDFLILEQRWLELARSIEFGESLDRFTKNNAKPNIPAALRFESRERVSRPRFYSPSIRRLTDIIAGPARTSPIS